MVQIQQYKLDRASILYLLYAKLKNKVENKDGNMQEITVALIFQIYSYNIK